MDIFIAAAVLALGVAAWLFYRKRNHAIPRSNQSTLRLRGGGKYEFAVVGVARHRPALAKLCDVDQRDAKTVEALLVPEHDAARNRKSVRVEVEGQTVGYLPTELAEAYRRRVAESGYPGARSSCNARISVRMHSVGGNPEYAVRLDLPQKG